MKRQRRRRFTAGTLAVFLCFMLNINPIATIAGAIADSGLVDRFVNLKNNLIYMAQNGIGDVSAAEVVVPPGVNPIDVTTTPTFECDATDAIDTLMGTGDVNLTDIGNYLKSIDDSTDDISKDVVALKGTTEDILTKVGEVETDLQGISGQLSQIQSTIELMQHQYRVAHLYSINNMSNTSYWRPYSDEVPYVKDFAMVSGPFASVYTGYWDTAVTEVNNPMGSAASRALEVLGYDAIVRYEGVVLQRSVSAKTLTGQSGESQTYGPLDGTTSAYTIATVNREEIGTDAITWLDAVTLLYKALGQELYTYQSFMAPNYSITPETSPAFAGLSNPVPTIEADGSQHYEGYDYNIFLSRSNIITGTSEKEDSVKMIPVYWTKAVQDGFIPVSADIDSNINPIQFLKLAQKMMIAYGEPEMSLDETKALLQVYGTHYPIQLGVDVADAWAYLKVRGCLADDVMERLSGYVSRDDALDICMRIKDADSRLDYKNIDIVLDIGELMRDDGYFPVYDLKFDVNSFSSAIEYNYTTMSKYGYVIAMTEDARVGGTGQLRVCSEKDINKTIQGSEAVAIDMDVEGYASLVFTLPKEYNGDVYLCTVDMSSGAIVPGKQGRQWIQLPAGCLGGGIYFGSFTINNETAIVNPDMRHEFDYLAGDKRFIAYADKERASEAVMGQKAEEQVDNKNVVSLREDATIFEKLAYNWDKLTSPMVVQASSSKQFNMLLNCLGGIVQPNSSEQTYTLTLGLNEDFRILDELRHRDLDITLTEWPDDVEVSTIWSESLDSNGSTQRKANIQGDITDTGVYAAKTAKALLCSRLIQLSDNPSVRTVMANTWSQYFAENGRYQPSTGHTDSMTVGDVFRAAFHSSDIRYPDGIPVTLSNICDNPGNFTSYAINYLLGVPAIAGSSPKRALVYELNGNWHDNGQFEQYGNVIPYKDLYTSTALTDTMKEHLYNYKTMVKSDISKDVNDYITGLFRNDGGGLKEAKVAWGAYRDDITFSFTFANSDNAGAFDAKLGELDEMSSTTTDLSTDGGFSSSDSANINRSVSQSVIMSREEAKLFKWSDLVAAGVVIQEMTGGQPKEVNGYYTFYTYNGMVRVNDTAKTIQIGTVLYDLMPDDGDADALHLVYFDPDDNNAMYLDVRCVMGIAQYDFYRDEGKTTLLHDSIGAGETVVYSLNYSGVNASTLFEKININCFMFPEREDSWDKTVPTGTMPMIVYRSTCYDGSSGVIPTGGDFNIGKEDYWADNTNGVRRLGLHSFMPTANWVLAIDGGSSSAEASLFVYYPMAPFEKGFATYDSQTNATMTTVREPTNHEFKDFTVSTAGLVADLEKAYPDWDSGTSPWYIKMTLEAIQDMYEMTGYWYFGPDIVIREFKLDNATVSNADAWYDYGDASDGISTVTLQDGKTKAVYTHGGNSVGAIYWLEGIGFVYNMPTKDEFTLEKYLSGVYPLPITCTDANAQNTTTSEIYLYDYNLNYWGQAPKSNGNGGWVAGDSIPYGYTLTSEGYQHYKTKAIFGQYSAANLPGNDKDTAEPDADGFLNLPFYPDQSKQAVDKLQIAPSGVYYSLGTLSPENVPAGSTSKVLTNTNLFYYGSSRVILDGLGQEGQVYYNMISTKYNPITLKTETPFYRVFRTKSLDVLVCNSGLSVGSINPIADVIIDDYEVTPPDNPLDNFGVFSRLLDQIEEGTNLLIIIAFTVIPMIGIILMTILIGLAFLGQNRIVKNICEKTIDPIRILTFGHKNIDTWEFRKVIFPCVLMYILFALFLNGNVIRLVGWAAKAYATVSKYARGLF